MAQVDQTQKYSSLLAQRLGAGGDEVLALPPPQDTPKPTQSEARPSAPSTSQPALTTAEANGLAPAPPSAQGLQVKDVKCTVSSMARQEYLQPATPLSIVPSRRRLHCGLGIRC